MDEVSGLGGADTESPPERKPGDIFVFAFGIHRFFGDQWGGKEQLDGLLQQQA